MAIVIVFLFSCTMSFISAVSSLPLPEEGRYTQAVYDRIGRVVYAASSQQAHENSFISLTALGDSFEINSLAPEKAFVNSYPSHLSVDAMTPQIEVEQENPLYNSSISGISVFPNNVLLLFNEGKQVAWPVDVNRGRRVFVSKLGEIKDNNGTPAKALSVASSINKGCIAVGADSFASPGRGLSVVIRSGGNGEGLLVSSCFPLNGKEDQNFGDRVALSYNSMSNNFFVSTTTSHPSEKVCPLFIASFAQGELSIGDIQPIVDPLQENEKSILCTPQENMQKEIAFPTYLFASNGERFLIVATRQGAADAVIGDWFIYAVHLNSKGEVATPTSREREGALVGSSTTQALIPPLLAQAIKGIYTYDDTVYVATTSSQKGVQGIFASTALYNAEKKIVGWTEWTLVSPFTSSSLFAGLSAQEEIFTLSPTVFHHTGNRQVYEKPIRGIVSLAPQEFGLSRFSYSQGALLGYSAFLEDSILFKFYAQSLVEEGATCCTYKLRSYQDEVVLDSPIGKAYVGATSPTPEEGKGWFFVGGEEGVAVLSYKNGAGIITTSSESISCSSCSLRGFQLRMVQDMRSGALSLKKLGNIKDVRALAATSSHLYFLTPTRIGRISYDSSFFTQEQAASISIEELNSPLPDGLLSLCVVENKIFVGTYKGLFYKNINDQAWEFVSLSSSPFIFPVVDMHFLKAAAPSSLLKGHLFVLTSDIVKGLSYLSRVIVEEGKIYVQGQEESISSYFSTPYAFFYADTVFGTLGLSSHKGSESKIVSYPCSSGRGGGGAFPLGIEDTEFVAKPIRTCYTGELYVPGSQGIKAHG